MIPEVPGLKPIALDVFDHGVDRAGKPRIPARPDFAPHFLLALTTHRFPDPKRALVELLERWGSGPDREPGRTADGGGAVGGDRLRLVCSDEVEDLEAAFPGESDAFIDEDDHYADTWARAGERDQRHGVRGREREPPRDGPK
ncbi:hypothetical protein ACIODX_25885 [Streptomyces sp. NPDC088190]|uniref:hypothetical protein n=1 Tax=unclassified Streptomyces TaxID=2593676 RepID=UPI0037F7F856